MVEFAPYRPGGKRAALPSGSLTVRTVERRDAAALARIIAARQEMEISATLARVEREIDSLLAGASWVLFVAELEGEVVGFGRAGELERGPADEGNGMPDGYYLLGVVVAPDARRQGIAAALTDARLAWIGERANRAYYFAAHTNRASIDLHDAFGFLELTRDFFHAKSGLERGRGVLFALDLDPPR